MPDDARIAQQLRAVYVPMFQSIYRQPQSEAEETFNGLLQRAREESAANPLADLDARALIQLAVTNAKIGEDLAWKRSEGVRDADLRWWWSMHDLERKLFFQMDFVSLAGYWESLKESGLSDEDAARALRKGQPIYIEIGLTSRRPRDEDFELPAELRERVNCRTEKERAADPSGIQWKAAREPFSSFNAFVRTEIRAGRI